MKINVVKEFVQFRRYGVADEVRERAEKFFDKDLIVPKYEMFYEKILNQ